jgi:L-ribulokinase
VTDRFVVGIDFGTESARALLVDVATGREVATSVFLYPNGVIDERLPLDHQFVPLEADWALQDPGDYVQAIRTTLPSLLATSGIDPSAVIGVGIDFTACTMLPVTGDGTPLSELPRFRGEPHAWVKLWKHHAAQPEADRINETARRLDEPWLARYGGRISSEWFFAKTLQILDEAPEIYEAADRLVEAADWIVWQLTGSETRNACTAGYKALWAKREGFPSCLVRMSGSSRGCAASSRTGSSLVSTAMRPASPPWAISSPGSWSTTSPRMSGGPRRNVANRSMRSLLQRRRC